MEAEEDEEYWVGATELAKGGNTSKMPRSQACLGYRTIVVSEREREKKRDKTKKTKGRRKSNSGREGGNDAQCTSMTRLFGRDASPW